jgi:hypothetical protein
MGEEQTRISSHGIYALELARRYPGQVELKIGGAENQFLPRFATGEDYRRGCRNCD